MLIRLACLLVALPFAVRAEPIPAHYAAYAAGLNVLLIDATIDVTPAEYRVTLGYRTTGAFGLFVRSQLETTAQGGFAGGRAVPRRTVSSGVLRGAQRLTQIDYRDGEPTIRALVPPNEGEREPVPPEQQRGTVDTLSAMAQLIRQVNQTGRCDGAVRTFDGRRLAELRAWTVGLEELAPNSLSSFSGRALHCDFEGRQLAGFAFDEDRARLQQPQRGSAWFAAVPPGAGPGGMQIPVRISFRTRWFGDATMFLK